jgi:uncharacterized protein (DUF1684 family)
MNHRNPIIVLAVALLAFGCGGEAPGIDRAAYEAEILEWRAGRLERLKSPTGYLNLVGLYWLAPGNVRIGAAADNDIIFPAKAAPYVGVLEVTESGVVLVTVSGVDVRYDEIPVRSLLLADDTTGNPVTLTHGSLAWMIIKRDERFALRLRDYEHPAIESFSPIEYFPIDPSLRIRATLNRFAEPKVVNVNTVIEGLGWHPASPGFVEFEIDGRMHELEAYTSGDELFFVFSDRTSGRESYPAGRFLYAELPDHSGTTILDFNRAYNPPCAFNDFATCPVASPRNRLSARIEAGEKFDPSVHATPARVH